MGCPKIKLLFCLGTLRKGAYCRGSQQSLFRPMRKYDLKERRALLHLCIGDDINFVQLQNYRKIKAVERSHFWLVVRGLVVAVLLLCPLGCWITPLNLASRFINAISLLAHYKYSKSVAFSDVWYWFSKDHAFSCSNNPVASAAV